MKKFLAILLSLVVAGATFTGCSNSQSKSTSGSSGTTASTGGVTKLALWSFVDQQGKFYKKMADKWNTANPKQQIKLTVTVLPFEDMHNKLLIALQSGVGAPDIADIEISKWPNFLKGTPQLLPLTNEMKPYLPNLVKSRVDLYSKDGVNYGVPFHVGATVTYYNMDIMKQAGVDPKTLTTWDQYHEAAKTVKAKTGKPMTTFETVDLFQPELMVSELGGDLMKADGTANLDCPELVQTLTFMRSMIKDGTAVTAPGGGHHKEEYYGFMNKGGAASVSMPMWYMDRFTDYMPDLKGKIMILPCPVFKKGEKCSVGLGGTGTGVTNQTKFPDLSKKFLIYAKLSKDGESAIWNDLGFDPVNTTMWTDPSFKDAKNAFSGYFLDNPFDVLNSIKNNIAGFRLGTGYADMCDRIKTVTFNKALTTNEDISTLLKSEEAALK